MRMAKLAALIIGSTIQMVTRMTQIQMILLKVKMNHILDPPRVKLGLNGVIVDIAIITPTVISRVALLILLLARLAIILIAKQTNIHKRNLLLLVQEELENILPVYRL